MNKLTTIRDAMRLVAATSAVLLATGAGSAFASTNVMHDNTDTGAYSSNTNRFTVRHNTRLDVKNKTTNKNDVTAKVNTGHNEVNYNTIADGGTDTGSISGDVTVNNDTTNGGAWGGLGGLALGSADVTVDSSNGPTGFSSTNRNNVDVHNDQTVKVKNTVDNNTKVDLKANTGYNEQNGNTIVNGDQRTGDISATVDVSNTTTNPDISGLLIGDSSVDVSTGNGPTGAFSENKNNVNIHQDQNVTLDNSVKNTNNVKFNGNTGHNENNFNTETGGSETGSIDFGASISNTTN